MVFSCIRELSPFLRIYIYIYIHSPSQEIRRPTWNVYIYLYHRQCRIASRGNLVHIFVFCFSRFYLILSFHLRLGLASGVYLSYFPITAFHAVVIKIRYSALRIVIRVGFDTLFDSRLVQNIFIFSKTCMPALGLIHFHL